MAKVKLISLKVGDSIADAERALLIATLDHHKGDKAAASRDLGISRRSVYNLMRKYGLFTETRVREV